MALRLATRVLGLVAASLIVFSAIVLDSLILAGLAMLVAWCVIMATRPSFWWAD